MSDSTLPLFPSSEEEAGRSRPGTRDRPLGVSEINLAARERLEREFPDVWVLGEISNCKMQPSGHLYFSLKDARSQINAVMFRGVNVHLRFKPADGLAVLARGRLTLYEARGIYQINVQWMEPQGLGSLQAAFEKLKAKLRAEGLFDPDRKRPIPAIPRRIGLVTSTSGAAIRDILRVLERRTAALRVTIAPCRVQGEGAASEIVRAIRALNDYSRLEEPTPAGPIDALIVGRGGGSLEDLWAFNEEAVARAIAESRIPVISAVGHETDITIADFVADLRAPTPSAAAEMVIRSREELESRVAAASSRLVQGARYFLLRRRSRLQSLERSRAFARVEASLAEARQRLDDADSRLADALGSMIRDLRERLGTAMGRMSPRSLRAEVVSRRGRVSTAAEILARAITGRLRSLREDLNARRGILASLSPLAVLDRGYAICQDPVTSKVISDASRVKVGDAVRVRLALGRLHARVERSERKP